MNYYFNVIYWLKLKTKWTIKDFCLEDWEDSFVPISIFLKPYLIKENKK